MKLRRYYPKTPHIRRVLYEKKSEIFQRFLKISENRENIQFDTLKKMSTLRSTYMFDRLMWGVLG